MVTALVVASRYLVKSWYQIKQALPNGTHLAGVDGHSVLPPLPVSAHLAPDQPAPELRTTRTNIGSRQP